MLGGLPKNCPPNLNSFQLTAPLEERWRVAVGGRDLNLTADHRTVGGLSLVSSGVLVRSIWVAGLF